MGCGFSSAAALDTDQRFLNRTIAFTFIEPFEVDRLLRLVGPEEGSRLNVLREKVQDVALDHFLELEANDILFVDSSHVSKFGSDANWLILDILPRLRPGVLVHFHDIFYPFEYPRDWLLEGRAWNEAYLLRAFLCGNAGMEILFWFDYLQRFFRPRVEAVLPVPPHQVGSSLWLRTVDQPLGRGPS